MLSAVAAADRPLDPPPLLADLVDRFRDLRPDRRKVYLVARTAAGLVGYAVIWMSLSANPRMGLVDPRRRRPATAWSVPSG